MNVKEWFEANNDLLCFSGCIQRSSWDDASFLHDEITKLFEAAQPKWLPIESAPKDGTEILINGRTGVYAAAYRFSRLAGQGDCPDDKCWFLKGHTHQRVTNPYPTLWQPLPAEPPKLKGE